MDIEVKSEPIEVESDNEVDISLRIKEEKELIIESDWLPTKLDDEENEYYQEFVEESNQNMFGESIVKNERIFEQYTAECPDGEDYRNGDYAEMDNTSIKNDSDEEGNNYWYGVESDEDVGEEGALESEELNKWIGENYISRQCSVCNEKLTNYKAWRKHITINHKNLIAETETNYNFSSDNSGVCKICNKELVTPFSRYVHSSKHGEDAAKLHKNICKMCNFTSTRSYVQKHILNKHPDVVKDFKTSGSLRKPKCPICSNCYIKHSHLRYHFMQDHPHCYKEKLRYNCHLCMAEPFSDETRFLQHLIEQHEFNSCKTLSYGKVFEDKEYIACTKCNRLFFENDIFKLLKHFLKHDSNFFWSCKFCSEKFNFKKSPVNHMCVDTFLYYEEQYSEVNHENPDKKEWKRKNLQEFEEHIAHVCPFCNKEFNKMLKWRHHLRTDHEIDTLKGLEMKVIANDNNKLSCIICHTIVANSPELLHAHRFQHLPYKPYKCLHCSITLNTFKMAVNHALKPCEDDMAESALTEKVNYPKYIFASILEVKCSLCNKKINPDFKNILKHYEDEHNYFEEFFIQHSDNSITCRICHKQYTQYIENAGFLHLQLHFDEKSFKCKLCLQSYTAFAGFYKHFLDVHNIKPIKKQPNEEKNPATSYAVLTKSSDKSPVFNEFAEFISYACPECNESMTTQQNWHNHIRAKHNFFDDSNLYVKGSDGSRKCPTCNITLNKKSSLPQQKHKLTHMPYRAFICKLCYFRGSSLDVIYQHFRRKHFTQGTFECPICAEVLQNEHQRTEHIKKSHPRKEWPRFMCLICYRILSNKHSLNKHMDIHNADRFKHPCEICGSKLVSSKDFKAHLERHKIRGETKEKLGDDITSQSSATSIHSDDIEQNNSPEKCENDPETGVKQLKKRKPLFKSSETKKRKNLCQ